VITVRDRTEHTGDVTLVVEVTDAQGADTIESLTVVQEFNFQIPDHAQEVIDHTGLEPASTEELITGRTAVSFDDPRFDFVYAADKEITEYISTNPLGPIDITQTEPGTFELTFTSEWPGRFPLHLTATDTTGNTTHLRIPIEIHWTKNPWEVRGIMFDGWTIDGAINVSNDHLAAAIERVRSMNVNYISINPIWYLEDAASVDFQRAPMQWEADVGFNSMSDDQVVAMTALAHNAGLAVQVKPMVFLNDRTWIGSVEPTDEWFDSYLDQVLLPVAKLAETNGVEMVSLLNDSGNQNTFEQAWTEVIVEVRDVFGGDLTLAESGSGNPFCCQTPVSFTDQLDVYGFQAYMPGSGHPIFPLAEGVVDPTVSEMIENMVPHFDARETEVTGSGHEAIATEMGIMNVDGANRSPADLSYDRENWRIDNQEQIDYYEAVLRSYAERTWMRGLFVWNTTPGSQVYFEDPDLGLGADVQGQPVEDLIRLWFAG